MGATRVHCSSKIPQLCAGLLHDRMCLTALVTWTFSGVDVYRELGRLPVLHSVSISVQTGACWKCRDMVMAFAQSLATQSVTITSLDGVIDAKLVPPCCLVAMTNLLLVMQEK